mmetsp:Transcript_31717/g.47938  ORF Transcript_31717/g.47938 Transcript_31717/m.47938 type:complete len:213 (+) Transcript_31717:271-909(+)
MLETGLPMIPPPWAAIRALLVPPPCRRKRPRHTPHRNRQNNSSMPSQMRNSRMQLLSNRIDGAVHAMNDKYDKFGDPANNTFYDSHQQDPPESSQNHPILIPSFITNNTPSKQNEALPIPSSPTTPGNDPPASYEDPPDGTDFDPMLTQNQIPPDPDPNPSTPIPVPSRGTAQPKGVCLGDAANGFNELSRKAALWKCAAFGPLDRISVPIS